jgi:DNA-binding transcriptional LysR family regulator
MSAERHADPPLPYLETFAKVAELSSFTAAAKELGLTQAAVSQRIQSLEQALRTAVFDRHGGGTLLTDAGRRLLPFAQQILALHREAVGEITGRPLTLTGDLSLAASSIPGEHLLPAMLAEFGRQHPAIHVRVSVTDSRAAAQAVTSGEAHLGLVGDKIDGPHLELRPFATDEMLVITPPRHAWAKRQRVALERMAAEPLILREPGSGSRRCLEQALAAAGKTLAEFRIALELGSNEAIKESVRRGLGVSVISGHAVEKELQSGQLHAVRITDLPLRRELYLVRDTRRALPTTAVAFLEFALARAGKD